MKQFQAEFRKILKTPYFTVLLAAALLCGYWFCCTHTSIGIDSLTRTRYLGGELFAQGRFSAWVLGNVFFTRFMPAPLVDFFAVVVMFFASVFLSAALDAASGGKIPMPCLTAFSCIFAVNPLFAEIFIYTGSSFNIAVGYLLTAVCCMISLSAARSGKNIRKLIPYLLIELFIWAFLMSLYESFILCGILFVCQIAVILTLSDSRANVTLRFILMTAVTMVLGVIFEYGFGAAYAAITGNVSSEAATQIFPNGFTTLSGIRVTLYVIFRKFFLAGFGYLPIALFALALLLSAAMCIFLCIKKKNAIYLLWFCGQWFAVFILAVLREGGMKYRTCQMIPLFAAFIFAACLYGINRLIRSHTAANVICIALAAVLTASQCVSLSCSFVYNNNRWLTEENVLLDVAEALKNNCADTETKPVVFTGTYTLPDSVLSEKYMKNDSFAYSAAKAVSGLLGGSLETYDYSEEYPIGVALFENMSAINWGMTAFDECNTELLLIYKYLGYNYIQGTEEMITEFESSDCGDEIYESDRFSIYDCGGYTVVRFS